jgi:DNA-binding PadR family transcriptional regulator
LWIDWSRKAHRGLRTWILVILQTEPKNGAEIMVAMEARTRGWWKPSPGSVYPMLKQLMDEGLIKKRDSDSRYEITPQGRAENEWPSKVIQGGPLSLERIIEDMSSNVSYMEDLAATKDPRIAENVTQISELAGRLSRLGKP